MKNEVDLSKKNFQFYYYQFKDSPYYSLSIISTTIVVCIVLLIYLVIPQLSEWFSIREEVLAKREQIAVLNRNIAFLNALDESELDTRLETATAALPAEKDFGAILAALSDSAIRSSVSLNDYAFQVGALSSQSAQLNQTQGQQATIPSITVSVSITGNMNGIAKFLREVQERLPLSDVRQLEGSGRSVSIIMEFYYKAFPSITYQEDVSLEPLSTNDVNLLNKLSTWKQELLVPDMTFPSGTGSAIPLF